MKHMSHHHMSHVTSSHVPCHIITWAHMKHILQRQYQTYTNYLQFSNLHKLSTILKSHCPGDKNSLTQIILKSQCPTFFFYFFFSCFFFPASPRSCDERGAQHLSWHKVSETNSGKVSALVETDTKFWKSQCPSRNWHKFSKVSALVYLPWEV